MIYFDQMNNFLIGNAHPGQLIGEVSMTYNDDPKKNSRLFTCLGKSEFAIVLTFNKTVFDILVKERLKKDGEILAQFIYKSIPDLK